ncbi:MAG: radical SAM protein [Planctomycetota bacterium]
MRVLLIEPPFERFIGQRCEWYPIGLTSIATQLETRGHTARVYNAEHDNTLQYINIVRYLKNCCKYRQGLKEENQPIWQEVTRTICEFSPDIVGISVKSVKIPSAFRIAEICKKISRQILVVAGGFHATTKPEDLLKSDNIDIVIRGEAEEIFLELVDGIDKNSLDLKRVAGVSFRDSNSGNFSTADRPLIKDLDMISFPKRELIIGYEDCTSDQLGWVMTSRGCPYDCAFCNSNAIWKRKVRYVSLSKVLDEIDYLADKFGITNINFVDDSFTVSKKRVFEFCNKLINRKKKITWSCLTRVDLLNEELIGIMKKAGCTKVDIGIESGSERIQKLINKDIVLDDVERISKLLRKHKIFWAGFFMIGFPTETREEILETLAFMKRVKPDWACMSIFAPYPGSKLYDMVKADGMIREDCDKVVSHQIADSCFSRNISPENFKKLAEFVFDEFNRYNSSGVNLLRRALSRNYHKNPRLIISDMNKFLSWHKQK